MARIADLVLWAVFSAVAGLSGMTTGFTRPVNVPPVELTSPVRDERYHVGDTLHVRWLVYDTAYDCIQVLFTNNDGILWTPLNAPATCIVPGDSCWQDFAWAIPDSVDILGSTLSNECEICLKTHAHDEVIDQSGHFSILDTQSPATNRFGARVTASGNQLREFLKRADGGPGAKIVFVNNDELHYIDFSESFNDTPSVHSMVNSTGGAIPVISPDGRLVTFASGVDHNCRTTSPSAIWACELMEDADPVKVTDSGYVPRFILDAAYPIVIYSTCGMHPLDEYCTWDGCGRVEKRTFIGGTV
ncbi:MAG: hypothetical protein GF350_06060, partial [Chitinivibrionales bacterium]|nr:hypothetical protein [Chitinivibrionales bacterium]